MRINDKHPKFALWKRKKCHIFKKQISWFSYIFPEIQLHRLHQLPPIGFQPIHSSRLAWATLAKCCFSSRASSQTFNCCCKWSICLPRFVFFRMFLLQPKKKITIENHSTTKSNHLSYQSAGFDWMWLMIIMKTITRGVGRKWVKKNHPGSPGSPLFPVLRT